MTRLFLSYGRGDDVDTFDPATSFLARLHRDLSAAGFTTWFDRVSMPSRRLTFLQEIRDAVAVADRVVLVVGPHAVASDYVRQEWLFALEADKPVTPILRRGDYPLVPAELAGLHCEDFREDRYDFALANLIRQLNEPIPPLAALRGVPPLPLHFLPRPDRLGPLIDSLRADLDRPVVLSGVTARVGLHGMGGIGKSVLAAAAARDRRVREAFPDGVVWVTVGQRPNVPALQRQTHLALGGDGTFADSQGRDALAGLLEDRAALLILDDVWNRLDVNAFDVLGPRCRCLITTRDAGMLESLGGLRHVLGLLTDAEALDLLALAGGLAADTLPEESGAILGECGRLPLAVALCGGLLRRGMAAAAVVGQLRHARIDRISDRHAVEAHHQSVWHAIHVGVAALPDDERRRFLELAVFPADEGTPTAAVGTLWSHTAGHDDWATDELLNVLRERSLLTLATKDGRTRVELHDLIHDYLRHVMVEARPLHEALLAAYFGCCQDGWAMGPDDGYFFTHLRTHLIAAGRAAELVALMRDYRWLEAKAWAGAVADLPADFAAARGAVAADAADARILKFLDEAVRRDLPFLARHPSAMFQCLWNSCWWYDCPEAADHYEPPQGGWGEEEPPWAKPVLSPWMRAWREAKEKAGPLVWVRSLRPPVMPLGGGMRAVCTGHSGTVYAVAFSPDGSVFASGSEDNTVRLWDRESGRELARLEGHEGRVAALAFSPDGRALATGSHDRTARLWDRESGHELARLEAHEGWVTALAFSPDGQALASGYRDGSVRIQDLKSTRELARLERHEDSVSAFAFSPDGRVLAIASDDTVRLWDWESGHELARPERYRGWVGALAFSPDGRILASGSDNAVRLWDRESGRELARLVGQERAEIAAKYCIGVFISVRGDAGEVAALAFSPDGRVLASGSSYGQVRLWDWGAARELARTEGLGGGVDALAFSPDGRVLAIGGTARQVRLWDWGAARELARLKGHERAVSALAFSPDGRALATGSHDRTARLWDRESGRELARIERLGGGVDALAFSPDGRVLASASGGTVRLWDWESGHELARLEGHEASVSALAFSPDGRFLRSEGFSGRVILWDANTRLRLTGAEIPSHTPTEFGTRPQPPRFSAVSRDGEVAFVPAGSETTFAWFPASIDCQTDDGHTFAGNAWSEVYLLRLEGVPPADGDRPRAEVGN